MYIQTYKNNNNEYVNTNKYSRCNENNTLYLMVAPHDIFHLVTESLNLNFLKMV